MNRDRNCRQVSYFQRPVEIEWSSTTRAVNVTPNSDFQLLNNIPNSPEKYFDILDRYDQEPYPRNFDEIRN